MAITARSEAIANIRLHALSIASMIQDLEDTKYTDTELSELMDNVSGDNDDITKHIGIVTSTIDYDVILGRD